MKRRVRPQHFPEPKPAKRRPEQELQRALFQHIDMRSTRGSFCFHPANGGKRSPIEAKIFKSLGVRSGVPDICCVRAGRACFLELKAKNGRLSPAQKRTIDELRAAGASVHVASDLDDAIAYLENLGFLRGRVQ